MHAVQKCQNKTDEKTQEGTPNRNWFQNKVSADRDMQKKGKGDKQDVNLKRTDHPVMEIRNITDLFQITEKGNITGNGGEPRDCKLFK